MTSQAIASAVETGPSTPVARSIYAVLGDGLRAVLIEDPVGLLLVPFLLRFPNIALESIQARFGSGLESASVRSPALGFVVLVGWVVALVGLLLSQCFVIRRVAARIESGQARTLESEFEGVFQTFPGYLVVSLLFMAALLTGLVLLAVPALLVIYFWSFAGQAAALDRVGIAGAFARARDAVRGQFGRWLAGAALVLGGLVLFGIGARFIWAGIQEAHRGSVPLGIVLVAWAVVEFVSVVFTAAWTGFYLDLARERAIRKGVASND